MSRVYPTLGSPLTPAEIAVLMLLSDGWTYQETADRLGVSWHTVREHVCSLMPRLGAVSTTHACVLWARTHWDVSPGSRRLAS